MKIAILSTADVSGWYFATLLERGHKPSIVDGHPPTAMKQMIEDKVDGMLILSEGDDIHKELRHGSPRPRPPYLAQPN